MIEVRNLAFAYRSRPVLRDVSFVASPGEVVSVIGANGAGKTTLLKVLATLAVPDSGQILLDGQDALARPMRYRRQIGYLPELPAFYEEMSVKEYLRYRADLKGEPAKRVRRRVSEAAEMCRVSDCLRSPLKSLSLGLRKRVALADALLLRPRVLLLDDFLAGLDPSMRRAAGDVLSTAAAFSSVIVTGHELDDFAKWTTRFLVLRNGMVAETIDAAGHEPEELRARLDAAIEGEASR
jgi:ABC-2 type transport system ATP-binding protein